MLRNKDYYDLQDETVQKLLDLVLDSNSKQVITIKAPTASGKTIMLIDFIDKYLMGTNPNMAFIWLCPGKGNLEEQSKAKMEEFAPHCIAQSLLDALLNGFEAGSTTFVNWELVKRKKYYLVSHLKKSTI